jgi:hypothetical protein
LSGIVKLGRSASLKLFHFPLADRAPSLSLRLLKKFRPTAWLAAEELFEKKIHASVLLLFLLLLLLL